MQVHIPETLAAGVRVLIYAGDQDFICNWVGNQRWVRDMDWAGKEEFNKSPLKQWIPTTMNKAAGEFQSARGLTFMRVYEAGHMVPMDQVWQLRTLLGCCSIAPDAADCIVL